MTKNQRELLILGGILGTLAVILVLRQGAADDPAGGTAASTTPAQTRPGRPAVPAPGTPGRAGEQDPGLTAPLLSRFPLEALEPGLADSAVAARIASGTIPDPFAEDRGRAARRPTPRPTQNRPTQSTRRAEPRRVLLDHWPAGVNYSGIFADSQTPGAFVALLNGQRVKPGDTVPGTPAGQKWEVIDVTANMVRIQWRDTASNTIREYRYKIGPQDRR